MIYTDQAIKKALPEMKSMILMKPTTSVSGEIPTEAILLTPTFWQSLGKAMGWYEEDVEHRRGFCVGQGCWLAIWHRFIDHLAEGKSAEDFFSQLP
jgi:hypothetical protein